MQKIAYLITGDLSCYTCNANAYQKIKMLVTHFDVMLLVPKGKALWIPLDFHQRAKCEEFYCPAWILRGINQFFLTWLIYLLGIFKQKKLIGDSVFRLQMK